MLVYWYIIQKYGFLETFSEVTIELTTEVTKEAQRTQRKALWLSFSFSVISVVIYFSKALQEPKPVIV